MRRLFVAGNWKMNTTRAAGVELARGLAAGLPGADVGVDVAVCPPFPYLEAIKGAVAGSCVTVGAQNVYFEKPGAFTGEVAAGMLADVGCTWVILGHSERRAILGESDELIAKKTATALAAGLKVILCVGEQLSERQANQTEAVLNTQMTGSLAGISAEHMANIVIAYEPVWAIGTGVVATTEQAQAAHHYLRGWLASRYTSQVAAATRILYGGSVKASNAQSLLEQPDVDGALVGGASLKVDDFLPIVNAARTVKK
jgi:triosephosphate isomerase (TIM)